MDETEIKDRIEQFVNSIKNDTANSHFWGVWTNCDNFYTRLLCENIKNIKLVPKLKFRREMIELCEQNKDDTIYYRSRRPKSGSRVHEFFILSEEALPTIITPQKRQRPSSNTPPHDETTSKKRNCKVTPSTFVEECGDTTNPEQKDLDHKQF